VSGTIGVIAADTGRYTLFSVSLTYLRHPPNTAIEWGLGTDLSTARNMLVKASLERGSEWMLFLDDDHVFSGDLLMRLLEHDEPMVCSLYLQRKPPFAPIAYSHRDEGNYMPIMLHDHDPGELIDVHAAGCSGMLVRSEVFRAIEEPWFEHGRVGELWNASEDLIFCEKVHEAGFDIKLDLGAKLGHLCPSAIWPSEVDGEWVVGFSVADNFQLYCPIEKPAPAPERLVLPRR
jgi:hypothetical protein